MVLFLCMKIRKVSQVPIIFITGRDSQIDELQALSLGGDDYIYKTVQPPSSYGSNQEYA